ncbi:odorant receptor Or1-like [Anopheles marshallii]|uniref:odorant receptor Or1-like n=1 Tax=Anopheles marshallii TaxID=1521116 RepID=UPI00237B2B4A|nr:odorant receptor Or1-like [Anopheles marshallii]
MVSEVSEDIGRGVLTSGFPGMVESESSEIGCLEIGYNLELTENFVTKEEKQTKLLPSLRMIFWIFGIFYVWPDEGLQKNALWWYRFKGILFRMFFIYLSIATQVAYNFTVTSRKELFSGVFILLTQLVMIMKMEFFYKNYAKIQKLVSRLEGKFYQLCSDEEKVPMERMRKETTVFWILYSFFSDVVITSWIAIAIINTIMIFPAWPIVDDSTPYGLYLVVIVYQYCCILLNASFNISWDSLVAALLALTNAHLHRLQLQLMKVGHQSTKKQKDFEAVTMITSISHGKSANNEVYNDLVQCIIFHQEVTGFLRDVLQLFSGPMLAQLYCSVFILCITEFRLLTDVTTSTDIVKVLCYLICLIIQVVQYCYFGNEIHYTSQKVHQATAFMNYPDMDVRTRKVLITFQQLTARGIQCRAKKMFAIELSMATFVTVSIMDGDNVLWI